MNSLTIKDKHSAHKNSKEPDNKDFLLEDKKRNNLSNSNLLTEL